MSPPSDLPCLFKSSLRVNVGWCMTATKGFHLSLLCVKRIAGKKKVVASPQSMHNKSKDNIILDFFFPADDHPLSAVHQIVCHFSLNRFPRCSAIGVSVAKVVYSACLPLHLLPPKTSWRPERAQSIILSLAQLWTCSQEWSSFTSPSLPLLPLHPHPFQTNPKKKKKEKKKRPPKFHRYTEVTHRRSKPERGSLFPAQKHFGHSHAAHCLEMW